MDIIYKHYLKMEHDVVQAVEAPLHWQPLAVGFQRFMTGRGPEGRLVLWEKHKTREKNVHHRVKVVFTGHEFDSDGWEYLGTCESPSGLVCHVYY